ncbi:hypothetical protein J2128_001657 [Methanomicrobium sp. W14]|uniref:methyltransferase domain-containing protein n=1 Tax=Methanomicrobium sp. W14 TaxID=2817839 RepID=UPI001AEB4384|nr:methyltransferase domain-containing protein [Methanomicrobium sp. W14]MBP2133703.1 hypothetical protein [Methanomicrobium sp. W14]
MKKKESLPDLVQGNALLLPFKDETFDAVYMVTVLQKIPDYPLKRTTITMGEAAGFSVDTTEGKLWNYTVRFRKP